MCLCVRAYLCVCVHPVSSHTCAARLNPLHRGAASPSKPSGDDAQSPARSHDNAAGEDDDDYPPTPPEGGGRLLDGPAFDESQSQAAFQAAVQAWRQTDASAAPVWNAETAAASSVADGGIQANNAGVTAEALAAVCVSFARLRPPFFFSLTNQPNRPASTRMLTVSLCPPRPLPEP